eukprot:m.300449 g.300449  ORF g.300449 m.300449 type:complete len:432 (-) comp19555_c6_seq3:2277-3572(-)
MPELPPWRHRCCPQMQRCSTSNVMAAEPASVMAWRCPSWPTPCRSHRSCPCLVAQCFHSPLARSRATSATRRVPAALWLWPRSSLPSRVDACPPTCISPQTTPTPPARGWMTAPCMSSTTSRAPLITTPSSPSTRLVSAGPACRSCSKVCHTLRRQPDKLISGTTKMSLGKTSTLFLHAPRHAHAPSQKPLRPPAFPASCHQHHRLWQRLRPRPSLRQRPQQRRRHRQQQHRQQQRRRQRRQRQRQGEDGNDSDDDDGGANEGGDDDDNGDDALLAGRAVLLADSIATGDADRQRAAQLAFEGCHAGAYFVGHQPVLGVYSCGRTSSVVFDIGEEVVHAMAVHEGFAHPHTIQRLEVGGEDATRYLASLLTDRRGSVQHLPGDPLDVARDIKHKHGRVVLDYAQEAALLPPASVLDPAAAAAAALSSPAAV